MTRRWPNYDQSQHYFLFILVWIQMWVENLGKYPKGNVYRNKESLVYIFLNCNYYCTIFSNHMKYFYLSFAQLPQKNQPTPPQILFQSSYPRCCMTLVHVHGLLWILVASWRAEYRVSHRIQSILVNCIKKNKPSPIAKKTTIMKKPHILTCQWLSPQADHSKNHGKWTALKSVCSKNIQIFYILFAKK